MSPRSAEIHRFPFKAMGSPCEVQLYADSARRAEETAKLVQKDVERLESRYSRYRAGSFLSEINRVAADGGDIAVDDETARLLDYAATCHAQSGGLFDITSGILRRAWRFDQGSLPDPGLIESLLDRVGWQKLSWVQPVLSFSVPGMEMDFGGIVKEYAADRAAAICLEAGAEHGVVNLGGDIRIVGPHADGTPWQIGIRHPRNKEAVLRSISMTRGALASSGDYERCVVINGVRYGHILNPKTGWPVKHLASVSVAGDLCVVAGSACTIAMLRDREGPRWLGSLGLPFLWVDVNGNTGGSL